MERSNSKRAKPSWCLRSKPGNLVHNPSPDSQIVRPLSILVDAGEAEAIALAQTTPDCIILLDDSRARKIAERLNIKQIGTIGLLLRAKRSGLIEKIRPHIDALVENGIYIRQELVDAVLDDAGEQ